MCFRVDANEVFVGSSGRREAERVAKLVSGVPLHRVAQWYVEVLSARETDFCEGNTAHCHDGIVR